MTRRFSSKTAPFLGALAGVLLLGCGSEQTGLLRQELTETKAAQINQADFDGFTDAIKLSDCTFVIGGGIATFTPSSELSQALFGDPDGSAHRITFPVPPIDNGSASVVITSMEADLGASGITLDDRYATVRVTFQALLHISVAVPFFGRVEADVQLRPSNLDAKLVYDRMTERAQVSSVTSSIDHVTRNCGGNGWCNGIVDGILRANLATWIEAPLRDALNEVLDDPDRTEDLKNLLVIMYNRKDPRATPWEMVQSTLALSGDMFRFDVERTLP